MVFVESIISKLKSLKGLTYIDKEFESELLLVFLNTPKELRRKLYNDIFIYSIKCPNEKSLESFQLNLDFFSAIPVAKNYAIQINRNCKNNYYKCS